jgi:hypothetical protein
MKYLIMHKKDWGSKILELQKISTKSLSKCTKAFKIKRVNEIKRVKKNLR